ncbi:MAG TPA: hypothetical protein VGR81_03710 [Candidatus Acidoferrales bacterium]|nr:hypothetical protein [Candidatus Acidoferrales bacterium]
MLEARDSRESGAEFWDLRAAEPGRSDGAGAGFADVIREGSEIICMGERRAVRRGAVDVEELADFAGGLVIETT